MKAAKWKPGVAHRPITGKGITKEYRPSTGVIRRSHHGPTWQLLTREQLDGRTLPARLYDKLYDKLSRELRTDLGEDLTTIEKSLADAYCITVVLLDDLSTRVLLGQPIDMDALAQVIRCQVMLASKLGIQRKPKLVNQSLDEYLDQRTGRRTRRHTVIEADEVEP